MNKKLKSLVHLSYNQAEHYLSYKEFRSFLAVWEWCAPRFGGTPGIKHDQFYNKFGKQAYYARINKVRSAFGFLPMGIDKIEIRNK